MKDKLYFFFYVSGSYEIYTVGYITEGNTEIIAKMIAQQTGAALFHIEPLHPYPAAYNACIEQAKKEQQSAARPAIKADTSIEDYDVVFLGVPNWWGDLPMPVYTFIEAHDWHGKTVIPFCTHEGSGLGSLPSSISKACKGATVLKGLAVQGAVAQNSRPKAQSMVQAWLGKLGY